MRIAINASVARDRCTGIGIYGRSLMAALIAVAPADCIFDLYTGGGLSSFLSPRRTASTAGYGATTWHHEVPGGVRRLLWDNWSMGRAARRFCADVLHSTTHYLPLSLPCPAVMTVHDMAIYHRYPATIIASSSGQGERVMRTEVRPWANRTIGRLLFERSVRSASRLIAVSETVRDGLQTFLKVPAEKIRVIYEGVDPCFHPNQEATAMAAARARYGIHAPYIISVATGEPRKNLLRLLRAFRRLKDQHPELPHVLVRVGGRGWLDKPIQEETELLQARGQLVQTGLLPHEELPLLYAGAAAAVYPSLLEGFGLPPLEAIACGVPLVASTVSAIREVVGDAALLVDPTSEDAIARALYQVLTEPELAARLRVEGPRRAARFTWEETARQTLALYDELAASNRMRRSDRTTFTGAAYQAEADVRMCASTGERQPPEVPLQGSHDAHQRRAPDQPLSVLMVTPVFDNGGTELQVLELGRGLLVRGDRYFVITGGGVQLTQLDAWNIPYRLVQATAGKVTPLRELAAYGSAVFTELRRRPVDIIQCTAIRSTYAAYLGRLAYQCARGIGLSGQTRRAHIPLVTTVHGGGRVDIYRQAARHLPRLADHVVAVSRDGAGEMIRHGLRPERLTIIPVGRDLEKFFTLDQQPPAAIPGVPEGARVIGTIARLAPTKGLQYLFLAFAQLLHEWPDLHLVILGTGELEAELRARVAELDITRNVTFAGFRSDVAAVLRRFDLYAMSSIWEGMPLAILEAMAGALPIVATAVGGVPELIRDGETGLLVPPRDPDALAGGLRRLLADPELARRLGQQARSHVRATQTVEAMVTASRALYRALCRETVLSDRQPAVCPDISLAAGGPGQT
jgi:glycosyltransferase involved in cell wall biosynthesis